MERVTGIGGVFFRAKDPELLSRWYADCLGVDRPPPTYEDPVWVQEAGPTVFAPMPADADQFGADHLWSINFRVRDLDAMVAQLRALGVRVELDPQTYPNGRFAHALDPEGNQVQLWEPAAPLHSSLFSEQ